MQIWLPAGVLLRDLKATARARTGRGPGQGEGQDRSRLGRRAKREISGSSAGFRGRNGSAQHNHRGRCRDERWKLRLGVEVDAKDESGNEM